MPEKKGAQRTYPYTSLLHRLESDKKAVKILRAEFVALNVHTLQQQSVFTHVGSSWWNLLKQKRGVFYVNKGFLTSQVFRLEHNNGRIFIVLVQQYGGRDVPRLFLRMLLGTRRSAIGQFFPRP